MFVTDPQKMSSSIVKLPPLKFDTLSLIILISGLTSPIVLQQLGLLFIGEILLSFFGIYILINLAIQPFYKQRKNIFNEPIFQQFLIALAISLFGFFLSDWITNNSTANFLRGWAKLVFLILDVVALGFASYENPWNIWWFNVGLGVGGMIKSLIVGDIFGADNWKGQFSPAISLLLLICTSPIPNQKILAWLIGLFGLVNMYVDARSLALQCLIVSFIIWFKLKNSFRFSWRKIIIPTVSIFLLLLLIYSQSQSTFTNRRETSNTVRGAGYQIAFKAIWDSPIIGYGSWAKNRELAKEYIDLTRHTYNTYTMPKIDEIENIPAHSQILQSWVEGGILGITFFTLYGYRLVQALFHLVVQKSYNQFFPLFIFNFLISLWHLIASPFASAHRISVAVSVVMICILARQFGQQPGAKPSYSYPSKI
jgi:O-antigen ligase